MKTKIVFCFLFVGFYIGIQAQDPNTSRVVFTVNMQEQEVSSDGVFIVGNFFNEMDLPMEDIGNGLYQYGLRVTRKDTLWYNFKNGLDQVEIFPSDSDCLSEDGSGNRILVVPDLDSLAAPPACYGSCQDCEVPNFLTSRIVISVDMTGEDVPAEGMFIRGNFFNGIPEPMEPKENNIWSYSIRASVGDTLSYQFGKGMFEAETLSPGELCLASDNTEVRMLVVPNTDLHIPPLVCYGSCEGCQLTSTVNLVETHQLRLLPNIVTSQTQLVWTTTKKEKYQVSVFDNQGKKLQQYDNVYQSPLLMSDLPKQSGLYLITVKNEKGALGTLKLVIR